MVEPRTLGRDFQLSIEGEDGQFRRIGGFDLASGKDRTSFAVCHFEGDQLVIDEQYDGPAALAKLSAVEALERKREARECMPDREPNNRRERRAAQAKARKGRR